MKKLIVIILSLFLLSCSFITALTLPKPCVIKLTLTDPVRTMSAYYIYNLPATDPFCQQKVDDTNKQSSPMLSIVAENVSLKKYPTAPLICKVRIPDGTEITVVDPEGTLGNLACSHLPPGAVDITP